MNIKNNTLDLACDLDTLLREYAQQYIDGTIDFVEFMNASADLMLEAKEQNIQTLKTL